MQADLGSCSFRDYLTGSWKHLLAPSNSLGNLQRIASLLRDYDIVSLQEADGGSLRSAQINQVRFLADKADFPFWYQQVNRNLGRLGQFSNGLLSRPTPFHVENHRLPGLPGRGAIISLYGDPRDPLVLASVHLALGRRYRNRQLAYLAEHLKDYRRLIVMGDFNSSSQSLAQSPFKALHLKPMEEGSLSYPSWAPIRLIDHILTSESLDVTQVQVLSDCRLSDHLPVAMEIQLQ
jgi:endonuclease/exonuclease/phosphatase family metal-dependent hydrolase